MKPAIKSFRVFKECIRKTGYINPVTSKSTAETCHLFYGFDSAINLGYSNMRDAYDFYRKYHETLDKYISENSFILDE